MGSDHWVVEVIYCDNTSAINISKRERIIKVRENFPRGEDTYI